MLQWEDGQISPYITALIVECLSVVDLACFSQPALIQSHGLPIPQSAPAPKVLPYFRFNHLELQGCELRTTSYAMNGMQHTSTTIILFKVRLWTARLLFNVSHAFYLSTHSHARQGAIHQAEVLSIAGSSRAEPLTA